MRIIEDNITAFCTVKVYIHTSRSRYLKHVPFKGFKVEMESCLNVFKILGL